MAANTSTLMGSRAERLNSVHEFNVRTLKTLNYYGGYTTTEALSLIHDYTKAGVRKRMNSMVKQGWVQKIEQDEGLGRSEQIWCITKSGRLAAQTENDLPVDSSEIRGFLVSEYSPALCSHTKAVQILASQLTRIYGCEEIRPFKMEFRVQGNSKYIISDIVFDMGIAESNGQNRSIYGLYEIELTVKPLGYYQDFLNKLSLYNSHLLEVGESYLIGHINFVTPQKLFEDLECVLRNTKSDISVSLVSESELLDSRTDLPQSEKLNLPFINERPSEEL